MSARCSAIAMGVFALVAIVAPLAAQSLAGRVTAARDGLVVFHFAARPGVCSDGLHFMRIGSSFRGEMSGSREDAPCVAGPVQVRLSLRDGAVDRVETWVGTLRSHDGRDFGAVPAHEAAQFMLSIAAHGNGGPGANALMPAALADSSIVWPALLAIARDSATRSRGTRQDASFWLSRFAAARLGGAHGDVLDDDGDDGRDDAMDLKQHAVFVLSQLPHQEGVPALLDVARTNSNRRVRSRALFWLGQSGDPRALNLFESLLM
ncbi:MAG: HEAT repeat domain-containing protein [bacterium]